ncbi:MAG TPA: glycoside hydrolase 43 family protein [Verrucomicrobiae bacterium]|nr:glycoside hydrolase 43 family protein [Verrucomicrobiae bacterium]
MKATEKGVADSTATQVNYAYPWTPDCGDGTYRNPILYADYSDPDVIRHGDDFWMTASSFNCTPGLPILHSRDLVNWTLVNHALKNVPGDCYNEVQHGCGVWAPSIRFHAGKFWIFFPTPDEGIYVITADDPRGQWTEPHLVQAGKGLIDPCPLWDDDGKAYLAHAYAHSRSGLKHKLRVCPMSPDGSRLLGEGQIVFDQPERQHTIEGPKFLKRDGWYYLLAPAGGVTTGWQTCLRSRNIFGPYEDRIVLEQGNTPVNGPHQGGMIATAQGEWWFLHFQDAGVYGRIVHLQPVEWQDGWPLIGRDQDGNGIGEPVAHFQKPVAAEVTRLKAERSPCLLTPAATILQTSDEFTSSKLGLQWQWYANHRDEWHSLTARPGWLRLYAQAAPDNDLARMPHLLLQKFPARAFTVDTQLELSPAEDGDEAGLVVTGGVHTTLALRKCGGECCVIFRLNGRDQVLVKVPDASARLRVSVGDGGVCRFSVVTGTGVQHSVPDSFQAVAGKWIGAKVGVYCSRIGKAGGFADFDYFRFCGELV